MDSPFIMGKLLSALNASKTNSTLRPDGIMYASLRYLREEHRIRLLDCIKELWHTVGFSEECKQSSVVPIFKQGKPSSQPENYRPISLTSNDRKLVERIAHGRLQWHPESYNDLLQTGFKSHLGTQDSLVLTHSNYLAKKSPCNLRMVIIIDV